MSTAVEETTSTEPQTDVAPSLDAMISDPADAALNGPPEESIESTLDAPAEDPEPELEPVAEQVETEWFDDSAKQRAEFYGFDPDTARSYGSPEALERVYAAMDRQAAQWAKAQTKDQPAPADQAAPQTQQTQQAQQTARQTWEKYKVPLSDDYDPDAVKVFNEMNDHYDKVVRDIQSQHEQYISALAERQYAMEAALQGYTGQQMAEETSRVERDMDTFFSGLGDEFKDVFGKSPTRTLAEGSPLRAARVAVWEEMNALKEADAKLNRPVCDFPQLQQRALRSLYGDKIKATVRKEIQQQVKAQQRSQIHRATGNQPKAKSGYERAVAKVAELMASHSDEEESLDDFTGF